MGRDHSKVSRAINKWKFQSTRPVWGATSADMLRMFYIIFQSTRPVWGATPSCVVQGRFLVISIHAPRVGRDATACGPRWTAHAFQSTRPVWGATYAAKKPTRSSKISIHAPRVGRDHARGPRPHLQGGFQSTRPVWGATGADAVCILFNAISIHAPRVGRDWYIVTELGSITISIHAPRVGRDHIAKHDREVNLRFQSTRPVWGATIVKRRENAVFDYFNPRAPCGARPLYLMKQTLEL